MSNITAIILLAILATVSVASAWEMSEFMIYLWGTPGVADPQVKARGLADAGFNVVPWEPDQLDVLQQFGLQAMLHNPTPKLAAELSEHPALWGYFCVDEPYPEDTFPPIAAQFRALEKADPHHPAFVNMLSTTGEFLRTYMAIVKPQVLSFDYYQWWWGSDRYFEKLEQFREVALRAGIPLVSCLEATANPAIEGGNTTYLPDNPQKLRQSLYTNLAYGVKGIAWYSGDIVFQPGSTELTRTGRDVAALNAEIKNIGPILVNLRSVDVYHTPPLARGTREAPKEHWVHLIGEEQRPGLVLGMFEDEAGTDYMLVANRDYRHPQSVVVRFQSKWLGLAPWHPPKIYSYGVDQFDKEKAEWVKICSSSFVGFTFVMAPGDGELFRISTTIEK